MTHPILVAGATGGVGRLVVSKLLQRGQPVRIVVRDAKKARALFGDGLEIFSGDVRQPATLAPAMDGVSVVICAIGSRSPLGSNTPQRVDFEGVRNLAQAAAAAQVGRFILVSSISATKPNHPFNAFGKILTWKFEGEQALRRCGVPYTIVRPGGLTDGQGSEKALVIDQGDRITGSISRSDVAEICIQTVNHVATLNATFEVIEGTGPAASDWTELFQNLSPDN